MRLPKFIRRILCDHDYQFHHKAGETHPTNEYICRHCGKRTEV